MGDYSNDLKRNNHNNDFKRNNNNDFKCNNNKRKNNNWHPVWGKIGPNDPTLTPQLMKLFKPPTLEYKPPPEKRKCPSYTGMAQFVANFAGPSDPEYAPPVKKDETPAQRRARVHQLRLEEGAKKAAEELEKYDPRNDPNISGDPYKTLFVTGLNYDTTEGQIKSEFEAYGQIKQVRLVTDTESKKSRGYAFIEYVHTRDMKAAYKYADGMKLDSRRVVVDVERGRTVPGWRPRRLGGGIGKTRLGGVEINHRNSGRDGYTSCEGGNYRERELEKSRDRPRDRDSRDDRHYRDRNRDKCRDHDCRDDRHRDRGRDRDNGRVHEDGDHGQVRDHPREKERDRQVAYNYNQGRDKYDHDRYEHPDLDHDRYELMI